MAMFGLSTTIRVRSDEIVVGFRDAVRRATTYDGLSADQ